MNEYSEFLKRKRAVAVDRGFTPKNINAKLFDWQAAIVDLACRRGSFGGFEDCGLGKSAQQLECSAQYIRHSGDRVLMLCPLAVSHQMQREAAKFDISVDVKTCRDQSEVESGLTITNYERLHLFDPAEFGGVVLDEGSILKSIDGKIRNALLGDFKHCRFKQSWTATPAPNDYMEIGNQAEFLGAMKRSEMLSTFFVHDGGETSKWRLKGHAKHRFWEWMASWCAVVQTPRDIGFTDEGFVLPPLNVNRHEIAGGGLSGFLFDMPAATMADRRHAAKSTIADRCEFVHGLVNVPADRWVIWCNRNAEGEMLEKIIPDAVEVAGRHSTDEKEARLAAFSAGDIRVLVTKPKIGGFGLNWQHCHRTAIFPTDSWEQWYQMIRRFWRFGQEHPVGVEVVYSTGEAAIVDNLRRKEAESTELFAAMASHMSRLTTSAVQGVTANVEDYHATQEIRIPEWLRTLSASTQPIISPSTTETVAR